MGRQFGTISQNPNTCSDSTFLLPERNLFFRCILRKTERYLHKSVHFSLICNNQEDYKQAKCRQQIFAILWYIYINAAFKTNEGGLCSNKAKLGLPGGLVVENPPFSSEDVGSIPGPETKVPLASKQLSPPAVTTGARSTTRDSALQQKIQLTAPKTQHRQINNF